jgi:Predicted integral membrane protein (DUF2269)
MRCGPRIAEGLFVVYQSLLLLHLLTVGFAFFAAGALFILRTRIEKAASIREALTLLGTSKSLAMLMPLLSLVLLGTGLALTRINWSFTQPWVLLGILGLVVMSVIGGAVLKPRSMALAQALASASELTPELCEQLRDPVGARGEMINIALAVAIVALMVMKPPLVLSLAIVVVLPALAMVRRPPVAQGAQVQG